MNPVFQQPANKRAQDAENMHCCYFILVFYPAKTGASCLVREQAEMYHVIVWNLSCSNIILLDKMVQLVSMKLIAQKRG